MENELVAEGQNILQEPAVQPEFLEAIEVVNENVVAPVDEDANN